LALAISFGLLLLSIRMLQPMRDGPARGKRAATPEQ
jgi:hypothetical protein